MKEKIFVHNLKCGGCVSSVKNGLLKLEDISNISVDSVRGEVTFDYSLDSTINKAHQVLDKMGYTVDDPSYLDTAKSYISCMKGKIGQ